MVLHKRGFRSITRLPGPGQVYLCISDQTTQVVKFVPARSYPYPEDLHVQLAQKRIAPKLLSPVKLLPGGFWFVEMEYLDPSEGWTSLLAYQGDVSALEPVIQKAISAFHQCLDGKAVHGDLRPPNIFVRVLDGELEVCFIDIDWSGQEGEAVYPLFLNGSTIAWPVADPVGKQVLQQHDHHMSKEGVIQLKNIRGVGRVEAFKSKPPTSHLSRPFILSSLNSGCRKWGPVKFC